MEINKNKLIENEIENLVSSRKTGLACKYIKQYLSRNKKNTYSRIKSATWFRRLGLFQNALRTLDSEIENKIDLTTPRGEEQIILCSILNILGASKYALRILSRLDEKKVPDKYCNTIGGVLLSNYEFQKSLIWFEKAISTHKYAGSNTYNLAQISKSDALCGLKNFNHSIEISEKIFHESKDPLIKFIAATALGEYLIKNLCFKKSLDILLSVMDLVKKEDVSTDAGLWFKWTGIALIKEGKKNEGLEYLNKSFKLIYTPFIKPEAWLEILYWIGQAQKNETFKEFLIYITYPTINLPLIEETKSFLKNDSIFIKNHEFFQKSYETFIWYNYQWLIDQVSDIEEREGKRYLNLNLSDKLIAVLGRCGQYGISKYRLLETLWPDELFSYSALNNRLDRLLNHTRTRNKNIKILYENSNLKLIHNQNNPVIIYNPFLKIKGLKFLLSFKNNFKRIDIEKYFNIKKTLAGDLLLYWRNKDCIIKKDRFSYFINEKLF